MSNTVQPPLLLERLEKPGLDSTPGLLVAKSRLGDLVLNVIWLDTLHLFEFVILNGVATFDSNGITTLVNSPIYFDQLDWTYFILPKVQYSLSYFPF